MKSLKVFSSLLIAAITTLISCSKSDPTPTTLNAITITNVPADPPTGYDPLTGQPIGITKKYTFFSFKTGPVANSDSATIKWDVGFNGTDIIVNSGTSGPGSTKALIVNGIFTDLKVAPDNGYTQDNKAVPSYAIPRGPGNGWYNYNQSTNIITPIAGKVLVFQNTNSTYAKMEIVSYYQGAPVIPTSTDKSRYYTFRFVYQPDGSKNLN